uniref:Uncharacterized protein n=1 Tax=Romanomermis culicivorax TaxID=13658 RepID=A0A915JVH5_ROMCU
MMPWRREEECAPVKAKSTRSVSKFVVNVFWDREDIILIDYSESGAMTNTQYNSRSLRDLQQHELNEHPHLIEIHYIQANFSLNLLKRQMINNGNHARIMSA